MNGFFFFLGRTGGKSAFCEQLTTWEEGDGDGDGDGEDDMPEKRGLCLFLFLGISKWRCH